MTGDYYVRRESYFAPAPDYDRQPDAWIQICISTHFLGCSRRPENRVVIDDHLGLDVWLRWMPSTGQFDVNGNTNSSAI